MSNEKHHFRKVYKSDHLGVADLEDLIEEGNTDLIFTIKEVRQHRATVGGTTADFNIAYFVEPIKPWALNAGNAKIIRGFAGGGAFVEDWSKNILVQLYIDPTVKMKGAIVGGVKVKPIQPQVKAKALPAFTEANFDKAKAANATIEQIKKQYSITPEMETKYLNHGAKN